MENKLSINNSNTKLKITRNPIPEELNEITTKLRSAGLRKKIYRGYPYFVNGTNEMEEKYLSEILSHPTSIVISAHLESNLIGYVCGVSLANDSDIVIDLQEISDVDSIYYISDGIIVEDYRYYGLGRTMVELITGESRKLGFKKWSMLCVDRSGEDYDTPESFVPLNNICTGLGFREVPPPKGGGFQ